MLYGIKIDLTLSLLKPAVNTDTVINTSALSSSFALKLSIHSYRCCPVNFDVTALALIPTDLNRFSNSTHSLIVFRNTIDFSSLCLLKYILTIFLCMSNVSVLSITGKLCKIGGTNIPLSISSCIEIVYDIDSNMLVMSLLSLNGVAVTPNITQSSGNLATILSYDSLPYR